MKIGAVSLGWSGTSLPEVFEQLAAMGGECIEINSNTQRHHSIILDRETIPQVRYWAAEAGLTIGSISGYCDFAQTDPDILETEIERLLVACRIASEMCVPVVRAFIGDVKPGITLDKVRANIIGSFCRVSCKAVDLGVMLGIENHGRLLNDGPALAALVTEAGAGNLGFTLDTGNFAWAGHNAVQVAADIEAVLPRVINVHIKDGVWTEEGFSFVPAGTGSLNLTGLLQRLREMDYQGMVYSEFEGQGDFLDGTRRSITYLKSIRS
ncbi:MAG: sugar phosphate isomerase/epimerase [Anaerolineae bacterium]|nr:sugar phosphate isomerase/epimerase [Anaerolineae bacterium]